MEKLRHFDTFSGYGGFTISAQKLGWETIGFSEVDKYANAVLEYNFNIKNYGDITKIKGEDLPTIDIITGGSPCQDLSVAGKGAGLDGGRSGLFFCFINLIKEKQPTYFVWENVKGALSSSKGWDFARVQIEMEQAGYDVWWQLLNAKDFGVPQNRERIFAIGIRKGSGREILFERVGSSQDNKTQQQVSSTIHAGYYKQGGRDQQYIPNKIVNTGHDGTNIFSPEGTGVTLKANGRGQGAKTGLYAIVNGDSQSDRVYSTEGLSATISAGENGGGKRPGGFYAIPNSNGNVHSLDANYWKGSNNPNKSRRSQVIVHNLQPRSPNRPSLLKNKNAGVEIVGNIYNSGGENGDVLDPRGISKTIKSGETSTKGNGGIGSSNSPKILEDMRIRRLTPTECERLMGLEDGWTAKGIIDGKEVDISDTQRYKMCGNGVVVNCVDYIYKLLKDNK